eukprot:Filipodium_phascolosomae@DN3462_c0_g1_i1.p1
MKKFFESLTTLRLTRLQESLRDLVAELFSPQMPLNQQVPSAMCLLEFLTTNHVSVIATDFDLTMTDIHSGGYILDVNSEVVKSLSEQWNLFAELASNQGLKIAVVTWSDENSTNDSRAIGGSKLVKHVLDASSASFPVHNVYAFYPRNYQTTDSYRSLGLSRPMTNDKSYHLARVCEDFKVEPNEVLLIDDTISNCVAALNEGYLALTLDSNTAHSQ